MNTERRQLHFAKQAHAACLAMVGWVDNGWSADLDVIADEAGPAAAVEEVAHHRWRGHHASVVLPVHKPKNRRRRLRRREQAERSSCGFCGAQSEPGSSRKGRHSRIPTGAQ